MKRTKKQNKIMARTKQEDKRSKFVWCTKFRHFQHVRVCKERCEDEKYCENWIRYQEELSDED